MPHYGHILAGTIKDVVTRYAYSQGYHVERRFGWDCHGLPVEYEIDKALGIQGKDDVMKMGVANYNNECRKIVMRYSKEWEEIIGRMGRWIGKFCVILIHNTIVKLHFAILKVTLMELLVR